MLPQKRISPEKVAEYLRNNPTLGAVARPVAAVRRLLLGLVLRRSTCCCSSRSSGASCRGCARTSSRSSASPRTPRSGWSDCRHTPTAWPTTAISRQPRSGCGRSCASAGSGPWCGAIRRRVHGQRREGLPQGDREPAVPLRAAGAADRHGGRRAVRLARQPDPGARRAGFCNSLQQYDEFAPGQPRRRRGPAPVLCVPCGLPGVLSGQWAADVVPGPDGVRGRRPQRRAVGRRQQPAAAGRGDRLPARPRVRAGGPLHRPHRAVADRGGAVPAPSTASSPAPAWSRSRTPTSAWSTPPTGPPARRRSRSTAPTCRPCRRTCTSGSRRIPAERDPRLMLRVYMGDLGLDAGDAAVGVRDQPGADRQRAAARRSASRSRCAGRVGHAAGRVHGGVPRHPPVDRGVGAARPG